MPEPEKSSYYDAYKEYAATLRTWLIAYGIGLPALILSNDDLWIRLKTAGIVGTVGLFLVSGVALQVVLAALSKMLMWILYSGESAQDGAKIRKRWYYKCADEVSEWFAIDVIVDLATIGLFATATYRLFLAVA